MTRLPILSLLLLFNFQVSAQDSLSVPVPEVIYFADMEVTLTESVRKDIQTSVDALMRGQKYFQLQVDKVDAYFPIIERILREEGLPDDFKYLAVQESALIPDAVSSSNAVGFWQFKKETAIEMGLRVDDVIDERMNVVSSTRAATKYLKKHNTYLENWLFSLLSYYSGLGGVQSLIDKNYIGKKQITLDGSTHWYIKKFLAHKVAFENAHGKNPNPPVTLKEYIVSEEMQIQNLAQVLNLDDEKLQEYNKWAKNGNILSDRKYTLIIPTENPLFLAQKEVEAIAEQAEIEAPIKAASQDLEPVKPVKNLKVKVNGIEGIVAGIDDDISSLAQKGGIIAEKLALFNDVKPTDPLIPGQFYYLKAKSSNSSVYYHTAKVGETMWDISQKYGVKLHKLLDKNRMQLNDPLQEGRVVWLKSTRPEKQAIEYKIPVIKERKSQKALIVNLEEDTLAVEIVIAEAISTTPKKDSIFVQTNAIIQDSTKNETQVALEPIKVVQELIEVKADTTQFEVAEQVNFVQNSVKATEITVFSDHEVKAGETLFAIARKYSVTVAQICEWNNKDMSQGLKVGEILKLKTGNRVATVQEAVTPIEKKDPEYTVHTVAAGETLYKIAKDYGLTLKEIMELNGKSDFTLSVGEQLKVKKTK